MSVDLRVAVFGGAGFIGRYLVQQLCAIGCDVSSYDLVNTALLPTNVRQKVFDVSGNDIFQELSSGFDLVVNASGISRHEEAGLDPLKTYQINSLAPCKLAEACERASVGKFVHLSSVYANSSVGGIYSASKAAAESMLCGLRPLSNTSILVLRLGSVYGPDGDSADSIKKMVEVSLADGVVRRGDACASRSFIHVKDCVRAIIELSLGGQDTSNFIYNVVGPERYSFEDLSLLVSEIFNLPLVNDRCAPQKGERYSNTPVRALVTLSENYFLKSYVDLASGISEIGGELNPRAF